MNTAQNLSAKKLEDYLLDCEELEMRRMVEKKKEAEAYLAGYRQAISVARDALHCSNYEDRNFE